MATFLAQVQSWVGTVSDTTSLDFWLQAAARHIINMLPLKVFEDCHTFLYDDGMGVSVADYRVISANCQGYSARRVTSSDRGAYADDESLFRSTLKSPCYYTYAEFAYVLPDGGEVDVVPYPAVVNTDSEIDYFPSQLEPAVALWAAIQVKIKALTTSIAALVATTLSMPVVPTALSGTPTSIGSFGSITNYVKPTLSGEVLAAPALLSVVATFPATISATATSIGSFGTEPVFIAPTLSGDVLAVPTLLSVVATLPVTTGTTATTIGSFGTEPVFTAPPLGTLTAIPVDLDLSGITPPILSVVMLSSLTPLVPFTFVPPAVDTYTSAESALTTDQDIELGVGYLQKIQTQLQEYAQKLQDAYHKFEGNLGIYRIESERSIEQQRLNLQLFAGGLTKYQEQVGSTVQQYSQNVSKILGKNREVLEKYQHDISIAWDNYQDGLEIYKANVQKALAQANLDEQRVLTKYQSDIAAYSASVQAQVGAYSQTLDRYRSAQNYYVQLYLADIQNELNKFNAELQVYNSTVQKALAQANLDEQRVIAKYQGDIAAYSASVQTQVGTYSQTLDRYRSVQDYYVQLYLADIQSELNKFNAEFQIYNSTVQKALAQAQIDEGRAIEVVRSNIQNYMAASQAVVAEFQSKIQFYNTQVADGIQQVAVMKQQFNELLAPFLLPPVQPGYVGRGIQKEVSNG